MTWLTAKGLLGLARGWWILGAIVAAVALYAAFTGILGRMVDTAKDAGATEQREGDLRETIQRVETGNEAREEMREALARDDSRSRAVYDQCLRTARTPANCERFVPVGEAD